MKTVFGFLLSMLVVSNAFAQHKFSDLTIQQQAKVVSEAKAEITSIDQQLKAARLKRVAAVVVGITSATVSVLTGGMALTTPSMVRSVSGGLKGTFTVIGIGLTAVSTGTAYGAYVSFKWYEAKNQEIDILISEIEKAKIALDASDRAYTAILQSGN